MTKDDLKNEYIQTLLTRVPGFQMSWQAHLDYWKGEEAGLCNDSGAFSDYVKHLIITGNTITLPGIFAILEDLLVQGDEEVQDAVATCILENLINYSSGGLIPAESFIPLLGKESRAYCRAWDDFTGVKTPGL